MHLIWKVRGTSQHSSSDVNSHLTVWGDIRCQNKQHSEYLLSNTLDRKVFQNICLVYFLFHIYIYGYWASLNQNLFPIKIVNDLDSSKYRLLLIALQLSVGNK